MNPYWQVISMALGVEIVVGKWRDWTAKAMRVKS
jgi:hypothetical protein